MSNQVHRERWNHIHDHYRCQTHIYIVEWPTNSILKLTVFFCGWGKHLRGPECKIVGETRKLLLLVAMDTICLSERNSFGFVLLPFETRQVTGHQHAVWQYTEELEHVRWVPGTGHVSIISIEHPPGQHRHKVPIELSPCYGVSFKLNYTRDDWPFHTIRLIRKVHKLNGIHLDYSIGVHF